MFIYDSETTNVIFLVVIVMLIIAGIVIFILETIANDKETRRIDIEKIKNLKIGDDILFNSDGEKVLPGRIEEFVREKGFKTKIVVKIDGYTMGGSQFTIIHGSKVVKQIKR